MQGDADAAAGIGGPRPHLDSLARFPGTGHEDRDRIAPGRQVLDPETAIAFSQGGGGKRAGRPENGDAGLGFGQDRTFQLEAAGECGRDQQERGIQ